MTETTTYAAWDIRIQVIEKCEKDSQYKFIIAKYWYEIYINVCLGLEQGFIDLRNAKDSIINLLKID